MEAICRRLATLASARERPLPRVRRGLLEARRAAAPSRRTRAVPTCGYVGWIPVSLPPEPRAPRRSGEGRPPLPSLPDRADAAEVVVPLRPAAHRRALPPRAPRARPRRRPARRSRARRRGGRAARSTAACGSRPSSRIAGGDGDERACAAACRPRRRSRARARRRRATSVGAIMLCHPRARLERAAEQVDLAEHAVQMQVEARQPVAGAEAEARRQHARVAVARRR